MSKDPFQILADELTLIRKDMGPIGRFVRRITLRGNVQRTCLV